MKLITALMLGAGLLSPSQGFAAAPAVAAAQQAGKAPAVKVTSVEGITEYRLGNGLRVLLFPDASKPTITTNVVYLVGSRHENDGETGMAHLLEHLLFKASANFGLKKGSRTPVELLNAVGARFNGTTWFDRTNYYATFPANDDNLRDVLALEADRMVNAAIDQNDLWNPATGKGEMAVVRKEFEAGENDPSRVTMERIQSVAYDWHNYGKSAIGARSDIEQVSIARLRAFYQTYYQPDNAVLMVAGRFDEAAVLRQVSALFGRIAKPARILRPTYTAEPAQDGERAVTVRRGGGVQMLGAGYHVAPSGHSDAVALSVLGRILVDTPGGRLHKALVDARLATSVGQIGSSTLEPGYRIYGAEVPQDGRLDEAQAALLGVLEGVRAAPVTEAEVARAKQQLGKSIELTRSDTARLSVALTESLAAGDWRLFFLQRDQLERVDAKAVQAVAEKYLKASNRTLGRFIPTAAPDRSEVPAASDAAAQLKDYRGRAVVAQGEAFDPSPANIEARTQRLTFQNGMKAALLPKKTKGGMVSVTLQLRLGTEASLRGKDVAGSFAAGLLMHGTERLSREQLKDAFDRLRAQVAVTGNAEGVLAAITCPGEHVAAALELMAEVLKRPAFAAREFQQFQREQVADAEWQLPEPGPLAENAMARLIDATPEGHVRHALALPDKIDKLKRVSLAEVKAFHAAFYGAGDATFAAVGEFNPAALKPQLAAQLGGWSAPQAYARIPDIIKSDIGGRQTLATPDKANSVLIAILPLTIRDDAADYPALLMANHMLGGGMLRSRLADRIRQREGLSYAVGSKLKVARDPAGFWLAFAISAPHNASKVEAALRAELDKALTEGFSEAELADAKKGWKQAREVARTQDAALAQQLSQYLALDRTLAYDQRLEEHVAGLTVAQANQGLRAHLKAGALSIVSAGDFAKEGKDKEAPH